MLAIAPIQDEWPYGKNDTRRTYKKKYNYQSKEDEKEDEKESDGLMDYFNRPYFDLSKMSETELYLHEAMNKRILLLDGAMGTTIQKYKFEEEHFRGKRFESHKHSLKGNNDLLVLTQPSIIEEIHYQYLRSGSDIIETNTFNATAISQADYETSDLAYEINVEAAKLAKKACKRVESEDKENNVVPFRRRLVAGAMGPLNKTLSISPSVEDPGFRDTTWQECVKAYRNQVKGLMDGGVDILMVETIFDTLNSKAAIYAILSEFEARKSRIPVFISGTIVDQSGRTLSGQTTEAFYTSIKHIKPFASKYIFSTNKKP